MLPKNGASNADVTGLFQNSPGGNKKIINLSGQLVPDQKLNQLSLKCKSHYYCINLLGEKSANSHHHI
jgi:hypothetical protein